VSLRLLLLLAFLLLAAAGAAGCGGSTQADVGPYLGVWQRVEGGAPNPAFTLTIARQDDDASVSFANLTNGESQTVTATVEDGYLACTLPTGDTGVQPSPSGVPLESGLQLSLEDNGQLIVDLVLADDTLEPIWIYERSSSAAPSPAEPEP
jgi:hypothetical protein